MIQVMSFQRISTLRKIPSRRVFWGALLLPFGAVVLFFLIAFIQERTRYAPEYFTAAYVGRYQTPDAVLEDLQIALQTGDRGALAALHGTRLPPGKVIAQPRVHFLLAWTQEGQYRDYLFFDDANNGKYMYHLKMVRGRYVVVPEGIYYYVDSGRWWTVLAPPAGIWWSMLILVASGVWVFQKLAGFRRELFHRG